MNQVDKTGIDLIPIQQAMELLPQVEIPVEHIFMGGVYIRQILLPAGVLAVGKRHRHNTCNMILKGRVLVYMTDGSTQEVAAPAVFESEKHVKKMCYALEDTIFINIDPTSETDLEKIEKEFIMNEEEFNAMNAEEA